MSEYKPKFEIGSEFWAITRGSLDGRVELQKLTVERITQTAEDHYTFSASIHEFRVADMYTDLKIAKEKALAKAKEIYEQDKAAIEKVEDK